MPVNIGFYISDYGFGHASRSIAIIRRLAEEVEGVRIYVRTGFPFDFTRRSLRLANVEVSRVENDIGVVMRPGSLAVDREKTDEALRGWVAGWGGYIEREEAFCRSRGIGLILSDISPQPFIVGRRLGVPAIAISNFTWHYIFSGLLPGSPAVERLREAYAQASLALVLPFNEDMAMIKDRQPVGLTSRTMTVGREEMRRRHGVADDELLVYLGAGMSLDHQAMGRLGEAASKDMRLLLSYNNGLGAPGAVRIPADATETQDYIGMCDLAITKTGYSTVSEAIRARVPLLLLKRDGFAEDGLIAGTVERLGIGQTLSPEPLEKGELNARLRELPRLSGNYERLEKRYLTDGTFEVLNAINDII